VEANTFFKQPVAGEDTPIFARTPIGILNAMGSFSIDFCLLMAACT
jgi:hypothetical protein